MLSPLLTRHHDLLQHNTRIPPQFNLSSHHNSKKNHPVKEQSISSRTEISEKELTKRLKARHFYGEKEFHINQPNRQNRLSYFQDTLAIAQFSKIM